MSFLTFKTRQAVRAATASGAPRLHGILGRVRGFATVVLAALTLMAFQPATKASAKHGWTIQANVSQVYGSSARAKAKKSKPVTSATYSGYGKKKAHKKKAYKKKYKAKRKAKSRKKKSKKKVAWKGGAKSFENKPSPPAKKPVKVASLGNDLDIAPKPESKPSLSGEGKVRWAAKAGCLNGTLKAIVYEVASNFGPVTVNSTCRSKRHNRRVGGARRSQHLTGNAVDFRVHSNYRAAYAYLKKRGGVGGYKHYGGGLFHIDTGPRRTW